MEDLDLLLELSAVRCGMRGKGEQCFHATRFEHESQKRLMGQRGCQGGPEALEPVQLSSKGSAKAGLAIACRSSASIGVSAAVPEGRMRQLDVDCHGHGTWDLLWRGHERREKRLAAQV